MCRAVAGQPMDAMPMMESMVTPPMPEPTLPPILITGVVAGTVAGIRGGLAGALEAAENTYYTLSLVPSPEGEDMIQLSKVPDEVVAGVVGERTGAAIGARTGAVLGAALTRDIVNESPMAEAPVMLAPDWEVPPAVAGALAGAYLGEAIGAAAGKATAINLTLTPSAE